MKDCNKLNLGSGNVEIPGYTNLDSIALPCVNIIHNLDIYPWPIADNSYREVFCDNVLEHLESIIKPMEELHRICEPKAKVIIRVPIFPGIGAAADPTHKQFFCYTTFNYFRPEDGLNYYSKARFKILKRKIVFPKYMGFFTWLFNINEKMQKGWHTFLSFLIPAYFLEVELEAIK